MARGIEMGHIFQLGRKFAEALDLKVLDENGKQVVVTMGSYGIGVSRAVAAVAESTHDELGLCWPRAIAPADVHVVATGKDDAVFTAAETLAGDLVSAGLTVLFDDRRGVSPGVKFKDAELLGMPTIAVVGRSLADGVIEVRDRRTGDARTFPSRRLPDASRRSLDRDGGRCGHLRLGRHPHAVAHDRPARAVGRLHAGL
jgi:prolyl-tRNA synthetase